MVQFLLGDVEREPTGKDNIVVLVLGLWVYIFADARIDEPANPTLIWKIKKVELTAIMQLAYNASRKSCASNPNRIASGARWVGMGHSDGPFFGVHSIFLPGLHRCQNI